MPPVSEEDQPARGSIPPRRVRAAAIAAAVLGSITGIAATFTPLHSPEGKAADLFGALMVGLAMFGATFVLILFCFALMKAGHEWNQRGGKPNPFTRDS
jgi:hypothetical protein